MGVFYTNITILGTTADAVAALTTRPALIGVEDDIVVLFAERDEDGSAQAATLSEAIGALTITATVHDDDLLLLEVHSAGTPALTHAVPDPADVFGPAYGGPDDDESADRPDPREIADLLVSLRGRGDAHALTQALTDALTPGDLTATETHHQVTEALALPTWAAGWGYRYLSMDTDGFTGPSLLQVGPPGA